MAQQDEVAIWLPFPPSVNGLFRNLSDAARARIEAGMRAKGKRGRAPTRVLAKGYKAWRREAVIRILACKHPRFSAPVVVKLELTPPDSRRRDADNFAKPVLDALVEARLLLDDSSEHVKAVIPYWENPSSSPGVRVMIRPARMEGRRETLNAAERAMLERIKRAGTLLVRPTFRASGPMRELLEKGYVRELPGLIKDVPQGYVALEANPGS